MVKHYLIVDGNSIGRTAQAGANLKIGDFNVQAIFGFLQILRSRVAKYSFAKPIVLWDGISWRKDVYPEYKENRKRVEKDYEKAQVEAKKDYVKQRPYIQKALSFLGVMQIVASNMEADDLAAILTKLYTSKGDRVTLFSEDQDWIQLVSESVTLERPRTADRVTIERLEEVTGCSNTNMFIEKKALMGDVGDNIKGIGGIGEKRALEFLNTFGSFDNFVNQVVIERTIDPNTLPKYLRDLIDDERKAINFAANIRLVNLSTPLRPKPKDMFIDDGKPSLENFRRMCELLLFKSILDDFDMWVAHFPAGHAVLSA